MFEGIHMFFLLQNSVLLLRSALNPLSINMALNSKLYEILIIKQTYFKVI